MIPLNHDDYFARTLSQPNVTPWTDSAGTLDAGGQAEARLMVPAGSMRALAGRTAHHAYLVVDPVGAQPLAVRNAASLKLLP